MFSVMVLVMLKRIESRPCFLMAFRLTPAVCASACSSTDVLRILVDILAHSTSFPFGGLALNESRLSHSLFFPLALSLPSLIVFLGPPSVNFRMKVLTRVSNASPSLFSATATIAASNVHRARELKSTVERCKSKLRGGLPCLF